jgi:hypothetical protein
MKNPTWNEWSAANESSYSMLHTYLKSKIANLDEFTFITDHKRQIMSVIEDNPSWAHGTKGGLFFLVAKFLKLKGEKRYSKLYSQKGYNFLQITKEAENDNKQDDKEVENYRDRQFFINVLEAIDYNKITTITEHYKYLLLSMLTYQPPVRSSFYAHCLFITTEKENNRLNNFIKINMRKPVTVSYIINTDKVSNSKIYSMNKELSIIKVINSDLTNLIIDSYQKYPRTYLFELNNKPISQPTLLAWLRDITKVDGINVDMMRSSYINWFYAHNKSMGSREKLANQMRHSVLTSMKNYLKVIPGVEAAEKLPDNIIELQTEVTRLKTNCEEPLGDLQFRKRRRDAIRTINSGGVPRSSTLSKYQITYDSTTKLYK